VLSRSPIRILLVDDDKLDRSIVMRALRQSGLSYTVEEAYDFESAIDAFTNGKFDCVLLDMRLPGRNGAEIFHEISKQYDNTAAVVFLTGENNEDEALEMMQSGAVDYINKDELSPSILRRAIRYAHARIDFYRELKDISRRDSLTGLPNRSVFGDALSRAVAMSERSGELVTTLLFDLDHFKDINDTLGHPAGDELLRKVADVLRQSTRKTDVVMRLGGDEFAVIASHPDGTDGAAYLAERIAEALSSPLTIGGRRVNISTSIGIAVTPHDGDNAEKVLKSADLALYKAKGEGRGNYCFFDPSMDEAAHLRQEIERDLRVALAENQFELHYQPKISARNGNLYGVEALIRWNHPSKGLVGPAEFIPIAESSRLIVPIGEWVLRTACAQIVEWQRRGLSLGNCSVNLSPVQLASNGLLEMIDRVVAEAAIDPRCLEVEVTESALLKGVEKVAS
jgi:diguanylate cyclase (GGDEF)-like protein